MKRHTTPFISLPAPTPGGLSWSGPGVPAGSALPPIIHLIKMNNAVTPF
jgi:hypothetical protein